MNIASYFQASAKDFPNRPALSWENGELTYLELQRIIHALRRELCGISRVGLLAHRSPVAFAGVQAILSSGAAYVPLKPSSPPRHNLRIQQLSGFTTLVVGEECSQALSELLSIQDGPLEIVTLGSVETIRSAVGSRPGLVLREASLESGLPPLEIEAPIDGTAYIIFTSGSTGVPKGVLGQHSCVDRYVTSFLAAFPVQPEDRLAQCSDITFDPSIHDQFVAWRTGATLVAFPDRALLNPLDFAFEKRVTVWNSVASIPALLEGFGEVRDGALPEVRLSLFGGEKLSWNAVQTWKRIAPKTRFANMYGPTETTIAITYFAIPPEFPESACHQGIVPIGKPFAGQRAEVRRPDGALCDPLEEGALWLGGDQLTAGYLDPEKTAERFVPRGGERLYRSGDIVFADAGGDLHFLRREDDQVKIAGYRIELGEIEAAILHETGAAFVVVDAAPLRGDLDELVCVLPTAFAPRKKAIRQAIRAVLEPHKLPKVWKFQDSLPLNANGKIDRAALKANWKKADLDAK